MNCPQTPISIAVSVVISLLTSSLLFAQTEEEKNAFVTQKLRDALVQIAMVECGFVIEEYQEFFDLTEAQTKKLNVFSKGYARKFAKERIPDQKLDLFRSLLGCDINEATFLVNGKEFTFEGLEREQPRGSFKLLRTKDQILLYFDTPRSSSGMGIGGPPLSPDTDPKWRTTLELSDEDLAKFQKNRNTRKRNAIRKLVLSVVAQEVILDDNEKAIVLDEIDKQIEKVDLNVSEIRNAETITAQLDLPEGIGKRKRDLWRVAKKTIR